MTVNPRKLKNNDIEARMKLAEQFVQNAAKMRNAGPDDPIEWNNFGMEPEKTKKLSRFRRFEDKLLGFGIKDGLWKEKR